MIKRDVDKLSVPMISDGHVAQFLDKIADSLKDRRTGNPAMSEALRALAKRLRGGALPLEPQLLGRQTVHSEAEQLSFQDDDDLQFESLTLFQAEEAIRRPEMTKGHLIIIATERFGLARSRLERMPKDELVRAILAALEHERSLNIISEEARRGGADRTS